jgi:hypothetical protein
MHLHEMEDRPKRERSCGKTEPPQLRAGATTKISLSVHWAIMARDMSTAIGLRICRGHFGDEHEPLDHFTRGIALRQ